jgi:DHA3 family macrolide efflux protein-like MFS transporter
MEQILNTDNFKKYLFFWSGQLISIFGSTVVYFVLLWWLTVETESTIALAIGSISYFVPMILVSLIAGVVADRYDRKKVILIVDSLQAFSTFIMILFFAYDIMEYWYLYFFFAFRSICQAFHQPTHNAIIPTMVPKDKLSRLNGANSLLTGIIHIIGPMVGATMLLFLTVEQALWIDVITFLIAVIPLVLIKIPSTHAMDNDKKRDSAWKDLKLGFKIMTTVPGLFALMLEALIWNFLVQPINTLLPFYVKVIHDGTVVDFAFISMSFNTGIFIGGLIATIKKKWKHKASIILLLASINGIVYGLFSFVPLGNFFLMMIYSAIRGFTMPILGALYFTILQVCVPPDKVGRITSIDNTLSFIAIPLGSILAGTLSEMIGLGSLFFTCAILIVIENIIIYFFTKIRLLDSLEET